MPPFGSGNGPLALVGAKLVDGRGGSPVEESVILVEGARITAVGDAGSLPVPPTAHRIDVTGRTVVPGLMDTHIHLKMGMDDAWKVKALRVPVDLDMPLTLIALKGFARASTRSSTAAS